MVNKYNMHAIMRGYVDAGLWSSSCNGTAEHDGCSGADCDASLSTIGYDSSQLPEIAWAHVRETCEDFVYHCERQRPNVFDGMDFTQVGHDLWLTSRRHGAGFWDSGLGERGDFLTACAHDFSGDDFYVDSNGEIDL